MTIYYQDNDTTLFNGDCRNMAGIADASIQCVVTSPPYWGLRKYAGVPDLVWDDWEGSYGLEPTPEMYVDHTIEVLREVRRVLRDDGVVFWNIGDSYARNGGEPGGANRELLHMEGIQTRMTRIPVGSNLKPKDLVLMPFRVALAVQADGWYVRSVIIWDKKNPMPESVRDRPTTSHEYIIMLTKSAKYYWDAEAVRETAIHEGRLVKASGSGAKNAIHDEVNDRATAAGFTKHDTLVSGRNIRSVWSFPSQPYPDAHFATFPEALPERCILAGTPEVGCCEKCGVPWERVVETAYEKNGKPVDVSGGWHDGRDFDALEEGNARQGQRSNIDRVSQTTGWEPTCSCDAGKVPSIVLDPFAGSGTTLWVAKRLGRKSVGYELSPEYCELAKKRLPQQGLL